MFIRDAVFSAAFLSGSAQFIGNAITGRLITAANDGGYFAHPFTFDETPRFQLPTYAFVLVRNAGALVAAPAVVRLTLDWTIVDTLGNLQNGALAYDWPTPANWAANAVQRVLLDNGNAETWAPNTFRRDDTVGLKLARASSHANDTFPNSVVLATAVNVQVQQDLPWI